MSLLVEKKKIPSLPPGEFVKIQGYQMAYICNLGDGALSAKGKRKHKKP